MESKSLVPQVVRSAKIEKPKKGRQGGERGLQRRKEEAPETATVRCREGDDTTWGDEAGCYSSIYEQAYPSYISCPSHTECREKIAAAKRLSRL